MGQAPGAGDTVTMVMLIKTLFTDSLKDGGSGQKRPISRRRARHKLGTWISKVELSTRVRLKRIRIRH